MNPGILKIVFSDKSLFLFHYSVFVANAFMVTYLVMAAITIVNMFVAVILENYTQATEDVSEVSLTQML